MATTFPTIFCSINPIVHPVGLISVTSFVEFVVIGLTNYTTLNYSLSIFLFQLVEYFQKRSISAKTLERNAVMQQKFDDQVSEKWFCT